MNQIKYLNEDFRDTVKNIPDNSIDLIVTSPPYFVGKEYEKKDSYDDYCILLNDFFWYGTQVLKPGGYMVVNFGDYYNSGNRFYESDVPAVYPAALNYYQWGVEDNMLDLQATRIWRKKFAKMSIPFVCNTHPRPIFDYEHIWTFRKPNGSNKEFVTYHSKTRRAVIGFDWDSKANDINHILGEDWNSKANAKEYVSAFPVELPTWAIEVYSKNTNDVVFDPFAGHATTALACVYTGRNFIGSEIRKDYYERGLKRIPTYDF
jgi:DNA modification methylase